MTGDKDAIAWAKSERGRLKELAKDKEQHVSACLPTVEFLRRQSGPNSAFVALAEQTTIAHGRGRLVGNLSIAIQALEQWIHFQESGGAGQAPFEVRARYEAATDLMEQVQLLLDDRKVHPAAPIVLAGAALEEFLRSLVELHPEAHLKGKRGIENYSSALRGADILSTQDGKDATQMAGLRNDAAHGVDLDRLTVQQAALMAQQVNLFIRQHQVAP